MMALLRRLDKALETKHNLPLTQMEACDRLAIIAQAGWRHGDISFF
jgi:hypothetical protein